MSKLWKTFYQGSILTCINGPRKFFAREISNWRFSVSFLNYDPTILKIVHIHTTLYFYYLVLLSIT